MVRNFRNYYISTIRSNYTVTRFVKSDEKRMIDVERTLEHTNTHTRDRIAYILMLVVRCKLVSHLFRPICIIRVMLLVSEGT